MKIIAVIPARMGSSRFPGKPLAPILGRSMIEHVYKRTALSPVLDGVYMATCDDEIMKATEAFGGNAIMTVDSHERASDRTAEAVANLDADVVVMVQGDEPMLHPDMIGEAVAPYKTDPDIPCINLTKRIDVEDDFNNPGTIKVVTDLNGNALYMSRQTIPTAPGGDFSKITAMKQVCIMPFRRDALLRFAALEPTPLEIAESIDMMRFLEHGVPVRMVPTKFDTQAVDTPEDLARVEALMRDDPLMQTY
ncbi:MAG: 3-deoxy-manno-octulosonate cytidylyltransferase [Proteobacteria bacterium]|nr:3-deoxy-manno-octulosonate cytidylyltransferase [Pseudomonadota bacterium]